MDRFNEQDCFKFIKYLEEYGSDLSKICESKRYRKYSKEDIELLYIQTVFGHISLKTTDRENEWPGYQIRKICEINEEIKTVKCIIRSYKLGKYVDFTKVIDLNCKDDKFIALLKDFYFFLCDQMNKTYHLLDKIKTPQIFSDLSDSDPENVSKENENVNMERKKSKKLNEEKKIFKTDETPESKKERKAHKKSQLEPPLIKSKEIALSIESEGDIEVITRDSNKDEEIIGKFYKSKKSTSAISDSKTNQTTKDIEENVTKHEKNTKKVENQRKIEEQKTPSVSIKEGNSTLKESRIETEKHIVISKNDKNLNKNEKEDKIPKQIAKQDSADKDENTSSSKKEVQSKIFGKGLFDHSNDSAKIIKTQKTKTSPIDTINETSDKHQQSMATYPISDSFKSMSKRTRKKSSDEELSDILKASRSQK